MNNTNQTNTTQANTNDQKPKTDWKSREVGALWLKGEGDKQRATGSIKSNGQEVQVVMFREKNKKSPNGPDYRLYLSVAPEQQQVATGASPSKQQGDPSKQSSAPTNDADTSTALF